MKLAMANDQHEETLHEYRYFMPSALEAGYDAIHHLRQGREGSYFVHALLVALVLQNLGQSLCSSISTRGLLVDTTSGLKARHCQSPHGLT